MFPSKAYEYSMFPAISLASLKEPPSASFLILILTILSFDFFNERRTSSDTNISSPLSEEVTITPSMAMFLLLSYKSDECILICKVSEGTSKLMVLSVATLSEYAWAEACLTPNTIKVINEMNQSPNKENLAMFPIDFRLFTNIFSPKYSKKKNGMPTTKKANNETTQTGALVEFTIL